MENMNQRLSDLEKSLRRTRTALAVLVMLMLSGGIMAAVGDGVMDVVRCHELQVLGPNGEKWITIGENQYGIGLGVLDDNGQYRLGLGRNTEEGISGYGFATWNAHGKYTTILGEGDVGNKGLYVMDKAGKQRAIMAVNPDDSMSFLVLVDQKGKPTMVKPFQALKLVQGMAPASE